MIEVTCAHYKMGNSSSSKSSVKSTKRLKPKSSFSFISNCLDHAFSGLSSLSSSASSSPPPSSSASPPSSIQIDKSDHSSSSGDQTDLITISTTKINNTTSSNKVTTTVATAVILPEVPINDLETEKKEPKNSGKDCYLDSVDGEKSFNQKEEVEGEKGKQKEKEVENENDVPGKVHVDSYLKRWEDYQKPSTSKPKLLNFDIPHKQEGITYADYCVDSDEFDFGDYYGDEDYCLDDEDNYSNNINNNDDNDNDNIDSDNNDSDNNDSDNNECTIGINKNESSNMSQVQSNVNSMVRVNSLIDSPEDVKTIGEISQLLADLAHSGHNPNVNIGPRSKRYFANGDSDDSDDSDIPVNNHSNGKGKLSFKKVTIIPIEDLSEFGIPRTQRINKDGKPIEEKCTCHHHQVISIK